MAAVDLAAVEAEDMAAVDLAAVEAEDMAAVEAVVFRKYFLLSSEKKLKLDTNKLLIIIWSGRIIWWRSLTIRRRIGRFFIKIIAHVAGFPSYECRAREYGYKYDSKPHLDRQSA
ncbi:unnamed protein product [Dimorphilus gyrociliatus]|uniref:Uncharacterized protein n=1 Tax=Dimorphilus gyrociliatus TaxID=2664684 RepID=A0A7I8VH49_9ANNE|nr:unnamed protein product [Dimorphilus gyrociliatus]